MGSYPLSRRGFSSMLAALGLAGCAKTQAYLDSTGPAIPANVQQLIAGAQAIEAAFVQNLPLALAAIAAATGKPLPAATVATVKIVLTNLTTATNDVSTAASVTDPTTQTKVQQFEGALNTAVAIAATLPIPEPYHGALVAATLTLPGVEALVGLMIKQGTALAATIAAKRLAVPA